MANKRKSESGAAVAGAAPGSADVAYLLGAIDGLMEIVEGVRGKRWEAKGKRLVDTPEWAELYVRWSKIHFAAFAPKPNPPNDQAQGRRRETND